MFLREQSEGFLGAELGYSSEISYSQSIQNLCASELASASA